MFFTYHPLHLERHLLGDSRLAPSSTDSFRQLCQKNDFDDYQEHSGIITLDVPGVKPKDLTVELNGDVLRVQAKRMHPKEKVLERFYRIPSLTTDTDSIVANLHDGILSITFEKKEVPEQVNVPVLSEEPNNDDTLFRVAFDVPGFKAESVKVTFSGDTIAIQAKRQSGSAVACFDKQIRIKPCAFLPESLAAYVADGVLTLLAQRVPKPETVVVPVSYGTVGKEESYEVLSQTMDENEAESSHELANDEKAA